MPIDPRIGTSRITGPGRSQYDELDRAFGVPDPANGTTPQRPMTTAEQAANLIDQAAELVDTANLGRLEELTTALEVLYRDGVGYPFRDAIGELGQNLSKRPGPQPGPGPSLRDLLTELSNRLAGTSHGERLDLPLYCRMALDSIPADLLDYRPGP